MKHVLIARFLFGLAAVSLSAAVMALVIQNHRLKSDFALLNRTMSSRIPVPAALDVGTPFDR